MAKKKRLGIVSSSLVKKQNQVGLWTVLLLLGLVGFVLFKNYGGKVLGTTTGKILYVSSGGSIQSAVNSASAGDVISVSGDHSQERVQVTKSNITIGANGEVKSKGFAIAADNVTIRGFKITTFQDDLNEGKGIWVKSGKNGLIENNRLLYNVWGGVGLNAIASNPALTSGWTIKNNYFFRNGMYAMEVKGQNHLIEGNEVNQSIQHHPCTSSTDSWLTASAFNFHGSGHIFRNNYMHNFPYGDIGFDKTSCSEANLNNLNNDYISDSHTDCFLSYEGGDKAPGVNILIENNRCYLPLADDWKEMAAKAFSVSGRANNFTVINNLFVVDFVGLFLSDGKASPKNINFYHNTSIGSNHVNSQGLKFIDGSTGKVTNNIFYQQDNGLTHLYIQQGSSVTQDYNCIWRRNGWKSPGPHDVNKDPLFVNAAAGDYRLTTDSPCKDVGTNVGVNVDINGITRPQGGGYDMGAYEYGGTSTPTPTTRVTSTPTPSSRDSVVPVVSISAPVSGTTVTGKGVLYVKSTASDIVGVTKMKVFFDSSRLKTCYTNTCDSSKAISRMSTGTHTIKVQAWDKAGNVGTKTVIVTKK